MIFNNFTHSGNSSLRNSTAPKTLFGILLCLMYSNMIYGQVPDIWLKFNENSEATSINNYGSNTNANVNKEVAGLGSLTIGTTDNIRGQVLAVNGDNSGNTARVVVDNVDSVIGTASRTLTGWLRIYDADFKWILNTNGNVSNNERLSIQVSNGGFLRVHFGSSIAAVSPTDFQIGKWNHFAVVYDGANVMLYVNGVKTVTESVIANSNYNKYQYFISYNNNASNFRIYNTNLSDAEITNIYDEELIIGDWKYSVYFPDVSRDILAYNKPSDASLLTIEMLNNQGFTGVNSSFLSKYKMLIEKDFVVDVSNPIESVLSNNQVDIQSMINNENTFVSEGNRDFINKSIFSNTYPKSFIFRSSAERTLDYDTYEDWLPDHLILDGIAPKVMNEEGLGINSEKNIYWLNRYAMDYPEKIAFVHFNGRSRDPRWENDKFFAGHWMYYPGTQLSNSITAIDTILQVNDASVFKTSFGLSGAQKNDDIVIVPLDVSGNKLWNEAEQVTLVAINNNEIKVIRGRYGTSAKDFDFGVYLAPHAVTGPWGNNNLMWVYNFSTDSPRDINNKRCLDILADEISSWFLPNGKLFAADGIQFDVSPRYINSTSGRVVDQDNNGIADNNSKVLQSKYELGVIEFYEGLRAQMGNQKLIMADGSHHNSQRVSTAINGIESEGFGSYNDVYKMFSKTINAFNFWNDRDVTFPKLNYVTHKDINSTTIDEFIKRERLVMAASQCLGAGFNSVVDTYTPKPGFSVGIPDELVKGTENQSHWLGEPMGDYIDLSLQGDDYWLGNGINVLTTSVQETNCNYTKNENTLNITVNNNADEGTITFENVTIPSGDFTFRFDAQAISSLPNMSSLIPQIIEMEIIGGLDYTNDASSILAFIGTDKPYDCSYYVRNLGLKNVDIKITIEGEGNINLSNFKMNLAPQSLARQFENGVVLANPSMHEVTFNLAELFPGFEFERLNGEDIVNDGSEVASTVIVPALDGLFLAVKGTLSGNEEIDIDQLKLYPNPVKNELNVKCITCVEQEIKLQIIDINGRMILQKIKFNNINFTLDLNQLKSGIYIFQIIGNELKESRLIVKE